MSAASLSSSICETNGQTYVGLWKEYDQEHGTFTFDSKQELTASLSFLALSEEALRSDVGGKTSPHTYKLLLALVQRARGLVQNKLDAKEQTKA